MRHVVGGTDRFFPWHSMGAGRNFDRAESLGYRHESETDDQHVRGKEKVRKFRKQGALIMYVGRSVTNLWPMAPRTTSDTCSSQKNWLFILQTIKENRPERFTTSINQRRRETPLQDAETTF